MEKETQYIRILLYKIYVFYTLLAVLKRIVLVSVPTKYSPFYGASRSYSVSLLLAVLNPCTNKNKAGFCRYLGAGIGILMYIRILRLYYLFIIIYTWAPSFFFFLLTPDGFYFR